MMRTSRHDRERRGRRGAEGRQSRRRRGVPHHAPDRADAQVLVLRPRRRGRYRIDPRRIGAQRPERLLRVGVGRSADHHRHLVAGAAADGRDLRHHRLDPPAGRDAGGQPGDQRPDQHRLRPQRLDVLPRRRLDPALLRERPGGLRHGGPGLSHRRAQATCCCR